MEKVDRPLSPHMSVYGWRITNTLSILHRATGLGLTLAVIGLAWWLLAAAGGQERYGEARALFGSGWMKLPLIAVVFCFFYHLANGIRHLAWDFGFGFDRRQIRVSGWTVVAVAATAALLYALVAVI
jgi:succinate dehydrogenase / fumarate reductase, cytochrome b subunit